MRLERLGAALAGLLLALVFYGLIAVAAYGLGSGVYVAVEVLQAWAAS